MITIPVAAPTPLFRWQVSFFQYQHIKCYGEDAMNKVIIPIVNRNHSGDETLSSVDWDMKLPYKMVNSIFDYTSETDVAFCASNVFFAAWQVIDGLDDDLVVEVQDCDIVHLRPYSGPLPEQGEVIVNYLYEDWHMHIGNPNSQNVEIIKPYLTHSDEWYPNGGFNTIVRVGTLRKIVKEIVDYSIEVGRQNRGTQHAWWQQMYGLNIACHNNNIHMIAMDNCYFPNVNSLNLEFQHQAHYSCDPIFNKNKFPNVNVETFPNNEFYNSIKDWLIR